MHHHETRVVPHTADQMFALVADVGRYPEFLPFVTAVRIKNQSDAGFVADVLVGYKSFREKFSSRVILDRTARTIAADYIEGPFKHLSNRWRFEPNAGGGCTIEFDIEFEFKFRMLERLFGSLFDRAVLKITDAFENRATALYGTVPVTAPSGVTG